MSKNPLGALNLYIDQYDRAYYASTVKELCAKLGRSKARKMYLDGKNGKSYHVGYVIGKIWVTKYVAAYRAAGRNSES